MGQIGACWGCGKCCNFLGTIPRCSKCLKDYIDLNSVIVKIVPATDKPSSAKAKTIDGGENEKQLPIRFGTEYPKALKSMSRLKRLAGTKWKAIKDTNCWNAIELIK